jgi:hypothetical protein
MDANLLKIFDIFFKNRILVKWVLTLLLITIALQQIELFGSSVGKAIFRIIN